MSVAPGVTTWTLPVAAAGGTVVEIWVGETTVKAAATPPKVTLVAAVRSVPRMMTAAPTLPGRRLGLHKGPEANREGEDCAAIIRSASISGPVKGAIGVLDQTPWFGAVRTVDLLAEAVECGELTGRSHLEEGAQVGWSADRGHAVEIAVGALDQPSCRRRAGLARIGTECVKDGQRAARRNLVNGPSIGGVIECYPIEVPVGRFD